MGHDSSFGKPTVGHWYSSELYWAGLKGRAGVHPAEEYHASTGATQRLVCCGGDDVAILEWLVRLLCCHKPAAHTHEQLSPPWLAEAALLIVVAIM